MSAAEASLLVIEGSDQGTRFTIEDGTQIGRGTQNPIRILDTEASRVHARIDYDPKRGWMLEDLDSSNGTYVNGRLIRSVGLESGDQIRLGGTLLVFGLTHPAHSSVANVDLVGGSYHAGHSNIIGTFSPIQQRGEMETPVAADVELQIDDVLHVMGEIAEQAVRPSTTLADLLNRVLRMILRTLHADRGCILLIEHDTGLIVPQASVSSTEIKQGNNVAQARMPVSKSIVDYVIKNEKSVRSTDPLHDTRFDPGQSILQAGVKEALCVPMQGRMNLLGAIYLDVTSRSARASSETDSTSQHLTDEKLRLLTAVARQCALAIENFRYQQSLVNAERLAAIGQTIATLSHHIKNILQGVRGGSYLIDMGLQQHEDEMIRKGWTLVEKNQDKIYNLVMDMLTFSKEREPSIEYLSPNQIVEDVVELMGPHAQEYNVTLSFRPDKQMPDSSFDPDGIHRAVLNIVTNAIDASQQEEDEQGTVEVVTSYQSDQQEIIVQVIDNGPGIPPELRERIFNVFESSKGSKGTGIGLAVSRKILREHGGDISLQDAEPHGSCFTLRWPYSQEAAPEMIESRTLSETE